MYCNEELPLTNDHVVPLSRGGSNNIDNILPACKGCNCSKSAKTLEEYLSLLDRETSDAIQTRICLAHHFGVAKRSLEDEKEWKHAVISKPMEEI